VTKVAVPPYAIEKFLGQEYPTFLSLPSKERKRLVAVFQSDGEQAVKDELALVGGDAASSDELPTFEVKAPDAKASTAAAEEVAGDKALEAQVKALKAELKRREKENTLLNRRISAFIDTADKEAQARTEEIAQLKMALAVAEDRERMRAALEERPCMCPAAGTHADHGADIKSWHAGPCVAPRGLICVGGTLKPIGARV
jgi:hypothetical protein